MDHPDDYENEDHEDYQSPLGQAIHQWQRGNAIPLTLAVELMGEGFDVPSLEAAHRNYN